MDMSVNIAGVEWKNPVTVASGTFGSGEEFSELCGSEPPGSSDRPKVWQMFLGAGNPTPRVAEVYRRYDECDWSAEPGN